MLIIGMIYPSTGEHGLLNPKALSLAVALIATGVHCFTQRTLKQAQLWTVSLILFLFTLLVWSGFIFVHQHPLLDLGSTLDQFKIFAITICSTGMLIYWYLSGHLPYDTLIKTLLYSNLAYNLIKCTAIGGLMLGVIDIQAIIHSGFSTMITGMGTGLSRIQLSTDIPTPYLLYFALMAPSLNINLPSRLRVLYLITAIAGIFFSYSRYLWAVAAMVFVLYLLTSPSLVTFAKRFIIPLTLSVATMITLGPQNALLILDSRFFSSETVQSDQIRRIQVQALTEALEDMPFLGGGLGSYAKNSIRDTQQPHSYEVQWVALLMQMGVFGWLVLFALCALIAQTYLTASLDRITLSFFCLYVMWLLGGFTNPFLLSLNSGIFYGLFYVTGIHLRHIREPSQRLKQSQPTRQSC
jgi:hypothetical protein